MDTRRLIESETAALATLALTFMGGEDNFWSWIQNFLGGENQFYQQIYEQQMVVWAIFLNTNSDLLAYSKQ
jgi:hypothetical protein